MTSSYSNDREKKYRTHFSALKRRTFQLGGNDCGEISAFESSTGTFAGLYVVMVVSRVVGFDVVVVHHDMFIEHGSSNERRSISKL